MNRRTNFPSRLHSVQFSSVAQSCLTLCNPVNHSMPGLPVHHQLPEFTQTQSIESVMSSNHLILCRPLFLLPPIPPSIRVFSNKSTLRRSAFFTVQLSHPYMTNGKTIALTRRTRLTSYRMWVLLGIT